MTSFQPGSIVCLGIGGNIAPPGTPLPAQVSDRTPLLGRLSCCRIHGWQAGQEAAKAMASKMVSCEQVTSVSDSRGEHNIVKMNDWRPISSHHTTAGCNLPPHGALHSTSLSKRSLPQDADDSDADEGSAACHEVVTGIMGANRSSRSSFFQPLYPP